MTPEPMAVLQCDPRTEADHLGYVQYQAPDGRDDIIEVTDGPSYDRFPHAPKYQRGPVWHVDITDTHLTISPSIDVENRYHTEGVVKFRRVDKLPGAR